MNDFVVPDEHILKYAALALTTQPRETLVKDFSLGAAMNLVSDYYSPSHPRELSAISLLTVMVMIYLRFGEVPQLPEDSVFEDDVIHCMAEITYLDTMQTWLKFGGMIRSLYNDIVRQVLDKQRSGDDWPKS
jgi:hypothetical protein